MYRIRHGYTSISGYSVQVVWVEMEVGIVSDSNVSDRAVGVKPAHIFDITSYRKCGLSSVVPLFLEMWVRRKREGFIF